MFLFGSNETLKLQCHISRALIFATGYRIMRQLIQNRPKNVRNLNYERKKILKQNESLMFLSILKPPIVRWPINFGRSEHLPAEDWAMEPHLGHGAAGLDWDRNPDNWASGVLGESIRSDMLGSSVQPIKIVQTILFWIVRQPGSSFTSWHPYSKKEPAT